MGFLLSVFAFFCGMNPANPALHAAPVALHPLLEVIFQCTKLFPSLLKFYCLGCCESCGGKKMTSLWGVIGCWFCLLEDGS